jgi:transketolase
MSNPKPLFSPQAKAVAEAHGLVMGKANLEVFSETLRMLAGHHPELLIVTSDSRGSGKLVPFATEFPDQIVEVGIAEQNLVGIAAGLASTNRPVYAVSPACFLTARSLEQIKNDVAYSNNRVNLVGISAGVSYGALGSTHHSLHDLAVLRAINNIDIVVPSDNFETRKTIEASLNHHRPLYLRFGKSGLYQLHPEDTAFEIGKAIVMKEGSDLTLVGTGEPLQQAYLAALHLANQVSVEVISMHTVKPLDETTLLKSVQKTGALMVVEEHLEHGGLSDACASVLMKNGVSAKFCQKAIPDEYTVTGSQSEIFSHYGLHFEGIIQAIASLLKITS